MSIARLGTHHKAGSKECPTTYQIRICPNCYAVLPWRYRGQQKVQCPNCATWAYWVPYKGPIDYARKRIMLDPVSLHSLMLAIWCLFHVLDFKLHLQKLLLYVFMKGLSYL